jgi:DNA-binding MarR family transcriptional regulator
MTESSAKTRLARHSSPTEHRLIESMESAARGRLLAERHLVESARQLMTSRIEIAKHIPFGLFRDSAWDVMLELFVNGEEGGIVYVKQLIIATGQAGASAVRMIDRLEGANLIRRETDPLDHRRIIVGLTEAGRSAMLAMLAKLSGAQPEESKTVAPRGFQPRR